MATALLNQVLTVSNTVGGIGLTQLTAAQESLVGSASYVLIQNTSKTLDVAWRDDGTAPTTAGVFFLFSQQSMKYDGNFTALKFIRTGASDVTLAVGWYA